MFITSAIDAARRYVQIADSCLVPGVEDIVRKIFRVHRHLKPRQTESTSDLAKSMYRYHHKYLYIYEEEEEEEEAVEIAARLSIRTYR